MKTSTYTLCAGLLIGLSTVWTVEAETKGRRVLAADYHKKRIAIVDEQGKVEWQHPIQDIHDLALLPNGNILFQTNWKEVVEMAPDKTIVWSYNSGTMNGNAGKPVEVHAFQRLPNGDTMIAESGPGRIIEVDKAGKIKKEVKLKVNNPDPHRDTRMVRKLENGNYLVCHEKDLAVREYNPKGEVVWEYKTGTQVYGAIRLPNGNTLIGTGSGHSVLEVNKAGEVVWSVQENELPGVKLAWVTTVAALPNGNILIGNCHAGPDNPQIVEVSRDKKVVWSFKDFNTFGNALPVSQVLGVEGKVIR